MLLLLLIIYTRFNPPTLYTLSDITTVVLTAGQSNAVGGFSRLNKTANYRWKDRPHNKIFVWAKQSPEGAYKWLRANIRKEGIDQFWITSPKTCDGPRLQIPENGTVPGQSHAGFYIARNIVEQDPNEVVGIIPTGCNGMPIEYWMKTDYDGSTHLPQQPLQDTFGIVANAIDSLKKAPNPDIGVDLVWWMQGEENVEAPILTDQGTVNTDAHMNKLRAVIDSFTAQSWFGSGRSQMFVANHIYVGKLEERANKFNTLQKRRDLIQSQSELNEAFESLNNDDFNGNVITNDQLLRPHTCSNKIDKIATVDKLHFDAETLSRIGESVADKYLGRERCGDEFFKRTGKL